jgi:phage shock protein A
MSKQMILGRVARLGRVDVEGVLDQAADPYEVADRLIREYTGTIKEADEELAAAIRDRRALEQDRAEDLAAAAEWGVRAKTASRRADELRHSGADGPADRFDALARVALGRQLECERDASDAEPAIAVRTDAAGKLADGLAGMRSRLDLLQTRRDELVTRSRGGRATSALADAVATADTCDLFDPCGELGRFEAKLRREETRASGTEQLQSSVLDGKYESLDPLTDDEPEIAARLAHLKSTN